MFLFETTPELFSILPPTTETAECRGTAKAPVRGGGGSSAGGGLFDLIIYELYEKKR